MWIGAGISLAAFGASVVFFEIMGFQASSLCWVNRMLMLALLLVVGTGIVTRDTGAWRYAAPFLVIGLPLALFQQLVHWEVIDLGIQQCGASLVCTTTFFDLFGFVSQATLCLVAFVGVTGAMAALAARDRAP
jgi:disulfide bond formation protein DsbB